MMAFICKTYHALTLFKRSVPGPTINAEKQGFKWLNSNSALLAWSLVFGKLDLYRIGALLVQASVESFAGH